MKKLMVSLMALFVLVCTGCSIDLPEFTTNQAVPEFSDEYLVGISNNGGYGDYYYSAINFRVIVTTDEKVLVFAPSVEAAATHQLRNAELELIGTLELSDEQYDNISKSLDRSKLFKMKVEPDNNVCDGDSYYLYLYGSDNQVVKSCGAYMPKTKKFMEMYRAVSSNLPKDEINQIESEYIDRVIEYGLSISVDE